MNPKVISIFNNAKVFLTDEELKELACIIEKELGKKSKKKVKNLTH